MSRKKFSTKALGKFFGTKVTRVTEVTKEIKETKETRINYDVIVCVGEEPDFKEFDANSKVLSDKSDEKYVIKIPNVTPRAFDVIIKYLSTGNVDITNKTRNEILNVIIASDNLKLSQLVTLLEDFLIKNCQNFLRDGPVGILQKVYYSQILDNNVKESLLETICFEPTILFNSVKFTNLSASLLEIILKQDYLGLVEIEIWENLIKWGLAQEKTLDENVSKWDQEKFGIFERILHKFIPLIRFFDISSEDYFNKVRPYEEILPKELQEEILKFHMIPRYNPTLNNLLTRLQYLDSILVNQRHMVLFANWIDRKEESIKYIIKTIPYKFNLIYRASRDGNATKAFHEKCDNKGATITIAKIRSSKQIVGGYNPLSWDSSDTCTKSTENSFIFSFTDITNLQTAKIGYSYYGNQYSIQCYLVNGPVFGGPKCDLFCCSDNGAWYSTANNSYPNIGIPAGNLNVEDYEVFQIIKR